MGGDPRRQPAPGQGRSERDRTYIEGDSSGFLARLLGRTRVLIAFAVAGLLLAAIVTLVYGFLMVFRMVWDVVSEHGISLDGMKALSVEFIELTDLFLVGTVLYIVALGLYELFIDPGIPVPAWLHVDDLEDLKGQLVRVIIVLLGVNFLVAVVNWNGGRDIVWFGGAIGLVILALSVSSYLTAKQDH